MFFRFSVLALALVACGGSTNAWSVVEDDAGAAGPDGGTPTNDGGDTRDTGAKDAAPPGDAQTDATWNGDVFGGSNYSLGNPGMNANASSAHTGQTPLQGKNCFQAGGCHGESSTKYAFMGTVFDAPMDGSGVARAEVRLVSANGTLLASTYSDDDGNFWFPGTLASSPSYVGVRTATASRVQSAQLTGTEKIACNSSACHGSTSRIHVP